MNWTELLRKETITINQNAYARTDIQKIKKDFPPEKTKGYDDGSTLYMFRMRDKDGFPDQFCLMGLYAYAAAIVTNPCGTIQSVIMKVGEHEWNRYYLDMKRSTPLAPKVYVQEPNCLAADFWLPDATMHCFSVMENIETSETSLEISWCGFPQHTGSADKVQDCVGTPDPEKEGENR